MLSVFAIGIGGFIGAISRYALYQGVLLWGGSSFPYATLLVNALGSWIIGFIFGITTANPAFPPWVLMALTTGFLGSFTTFSTFSYDTLLLFQQDHFLHGLANIFLNVCLGLTFCWLGVRLARVMV